MHHQHLVCALAGQVADALDEKGIFLCSGVLKEQVEKLEKAYMAQGMQLQKCDSQGDFVVCQFTKTAL
jgi:ribosomal protein L11 methylase PrmA